MHLSGVKREEEEEEEVEDKEALSPTFAPTLPPLPALALSIPS